MTYRIGPPTTAQEWETYHSIREEVLWLARGRVGVYDRAHPDDYVPQHHPLLMAVEGRPVAVARLDVDGNTAWLRRVAVVGEEQRKGYGKALVSHAEVLAAQEGCSRILSNVDPGAVGFYIRCGFVETDRAAGSGPITVEKSLGDRQK